MQKRLILSLVILVTAMVTAVAQPKTGTTVPELALPTQSGTTLKLSSLRGKYVVLDFWASWCGPCMSGMPEMKKSYAKYKGKVEFLGVNCDDNVADWKKAVKAAALPWKHVNYNGNIQMMKAFNVSGLPTKIIVDPKGKVVYSCVGEMPEFYTKLAAILK